MQKQFFFVCFRLLRSLRFQTKKRFENGLKSEWRLLKMELIENGVALMGINQIPKKHEQCNL